MFTNIPYGCLDLHSENITPVQWITISYKSNFCYSYDLEGGASEYFEIEESETVTKIIKRDYTQPDCKGEDRATEYIVGECNLGHFVYSDRAHPQTTFGSIAPNYANPFSDQT